MKKPQGIGITVTVECITSERKSFSGTYSPKFMRFLSECKTNYWFVLTAKKRRQFLDKVKMSQLLDQPDPLFEGTDPKAIENLTQFILNPDHRTRRMVVRTGIRQL